MWPTRTWRGGRRASRPRARHPFADLLAPVQFQLPEDVLNLGVNRAFGEAKTGRDRGVGQTRGEELADISLPRREGREPWSGSVAYADELGDLTRRVVEHAVLPDRAIAARGCGRDARGRDEREGSRRTLEEGPPVHTTKTTARAICLTVPGRSRTPRRRGGRERTRSASARGGTGPGTRPRRHLR